MLYYVIIIEHIDSNILFILDYILIRNLMRVTTNEYFDTVSNKVKRKIYSDA